MKVKYIRVQAKASDLQDFGFLDGLLHLLHEHDGYGVVPGVGNGDYIDFSVENETGRIVGWKPFTDEELESLIEEDNR